MFTFSHRPAGARTWVQEKSDGTLVARNSQPSPIGAYSAYSPTWRADFTWPPGVWNAADSTVAPMSGQNLVVDLRPVGRARRPFCVASAVFLLLIDALITALFIGLTIDGQWPAAILGLPVAALIGWMSIGLGWRNPLAPSKRVREQQRQEFLRELAEMTGATIRVENEADHQ